MGGKSGGGTTTSIQDVPPEFKPAFFRLFNSALASAQQGAGSPFGAQPAFAAGAPAGQPFPGQTVFPGQFPVPVSQPTVRRGAQGNIIGTRPAGPPSFNPQVGQQFLAGGGQVDPASVFTTGSSQIPLAGGPPIVGEPFPGPFTAPTTGIELESLMAREAVGRQLGGAGGALLGLGQQQALGQFLDPRTNPFFTQNIEASLQPAVDAFTRSVIPQFSSQAIQSGAFKGSSARDLALGNIANEFGRNLLQTAAQQGFQNFLQERQIQQQTPQLLQQAAGLQQLTPEILAQVGAGQREILQRPLDEALLQFQEAQQAPFRPLGPLASILFGGNIGTTQQITPPRPSPLAAGIAGGLGGGALGLSLGEQLFGSGAGAGGLGGLGALLGALGGGLG